MHEADSKAEREKGHSLVWGGNFGLKWTKIVQNRKGFGQICHFSIKKKKNSSTSLQPKTEKGILEFYGVPVLVWDVLDHDSSITAECGILFHRSCRRRRGGR